MYESFNPGPRMAEETGIDFVQIDGLKGFLFVAEKLGALLIAKPDEVKVNKGGSSGIRRKSLAKRNREEDREVRHGLGMDLRNFWKKHPNKATEVGMLLTVYENSPCSECREFALTRLIKLKALPKHIREECAYDSNETIRESIAGAPQVP